MTTFNIDDHLSIERVVIKVIDLERQTAFYEKVVGLSIVEKKQQYTTFSAGEGEPVLLELQKVAEKMQPAISTGLFHTAFLLPDRAAFATKFFDILRNKETVDSPLEQENRFPHFERIIPIAKLDSASDHGYSEAFYLSDIEGNGIEIYADRPREQWDQYPGGSNPLDFKALAPLADFDTDGKLPAGTTVGHVHLRVDQFEDTLAFYNEVLGFEKQEVYDDVFFVGAGGYHHHVAGNTWSGDKPARPIDRHSGLKEVRFLLSSKEAFDDFKFHVKQQVAFQDLEHAIVVTDPSGNRLVFAY
ncbi:VOC family protein [Kurthia massiliensis]|uniref:VOC family protein n=1 Tax=Kurthia massiliensis TaxID=1033739 RepID=UPI0002887A58|nr:VOC family protein [Kurthia massiliensis]